MIKEIIGVRFNRVGEIYYYEPNRMKFNTSTSYVIAENNNGIFFGKVVIGNRELETDSLKLPYKEKSIRPIIRPATPDDIVINKRNKIQDKEAFKVFVDCINEHNLKMHPLKVESTFDNQKMIFYFSADGRVDFRELVKNLAGKFKTRIELRQIGAREVAKMLGGIGLCGREFCCRKYTTDFVGVTVNMAKLQSISLNPVKISGTCGRLMCCLSHENDAYKEYAKITPNVGSYVQYGKDKGTVTDSNLITGKLRIQPDEEKGTPVYIERSKVKVIKEGALKENVKEEKEIKELLEKN
ncbi:MAG: stage 0 sporulation protein [Ruminococcus sp.]|nr:stage 0 sporulation protein [Ruminococcus sp.]